MLRLPRAAFLAAAALALAPSACERDDVEIVPPTSGRALSREEQSAIRSVAGRALRDARGALPTLPPRLTLTIVYGKDVIPETGENGTTVPPAEIVWTVDPDRGVLDVVRRQLRPTLFHELHHLARRQATPPKRTLVDTAIDEGMATAFERDFGGADPPWGKAPPEIADWTRELLRQPEAAPRHAWLVRHPDGRRWIGYRVGTFLVDRATKASGRSSAALVATPTDEVLRLADVRP